MLLVTCSPVPGFDVYRCGWREEVRDGRTVRVGLTWPAGTTVLRDGELTAEQVDALRRDPGKRLTVRQVADPSEHGAAAEHGAEELGAARWCRGPAPRGGCGGQHAAERPPRRARAAPVRLAVRTPNRTRVLERVPWVGNVYPYAQPYAATPCALPFAGAKGGT
jgi:hypothetical protein